MDSKSKKTGNAGNNEKTHHLSTLQKNLIPKLLRLRGASSNINETEMGEYLLNSYNIDGYKVKIRSNGNADTSKYNRLANGKNLLDKVMTKDEKDNWLDLIDQERKLLLKEIALDAAIYESFKFNFESSKELIDDICHEENPAEYCVYLNTQLDLNQFFKPTIQLHLALQKSIEQKLNFSRMGYCLQEVKNNDKKTKKKKIQGCQQNPPRFRNYRILFLPFTTEELKQQGEQYKENLRFLCSIHLSLSIQLALVTVDQLEHILRSHNDLLGLDFSSLGLDENVKDSLKRSEEFDAINSLKLCIQNQSAAKTDNKLDYLYIKKTTPESSSLWNATMDNTRGLTYKKITDDAKHTKRKFVEFLFDETSKEMHPSSQNIQYSFLDPYFDLFLNHQDNILSFNSHYNAHLQ